MNLTKKTGSAVTASSGIARVSFCFYPAAGNSRLFEHLVNLCLKGFAGRAREDIHRDHAHCEQELGDRDDVVGVAKDCNVFSLVMEMRVNQRIYDLTAFEREGRGDIDPEPVFYRHDEIVGRFDTDGQF